MTFPGSQISLPQGITAAELSNASWGWAGVRLVIHDADNVKLVPWNEGGPWINVNGELVQIGVTNCACGITDNTIGSDGLDTGVTPSPDTLYFVFVGNSASTFGLYSLRLCADPPIADERGIYYAGGDPDTNYRCVGAVFTNGSPGFTDTETARFVVSLYNPLPAKVYVCPNYANDNSDTTYSLNTATWATINGGSNDSIQYLSLAFQPAVFVLNVTVNALGAAAAQFGISALGGTAPGLDPSAAARLPALAAGACQITYADDRHVPDGIVQAAVRTVSMLGMTGGVAATIVADFARNGATSDPPATYLTGTVPT